jgi:hypothetical protein
MAHRAEGEMAAPQDPGWVLLHRAATPGLVYRLAGWRRVAAIGDGRLVIQVHGRGSAHLYYRNPDGEGRDACLRRQTWILRIPASCGASRATLREEGCLAHGDAACGYVVTWAEAPRLATAVLAGVLAAAAVASTRLPAVSPTSWLIVPAVILTTYAFERRRVARTNPLASAQSGAAFRWLVGRALAGEQTHGVGQTDTRSARRPGAGVVIEQEGGVWRVAYQGTTIRLRHSRGLALLAHLVRSPGREIHVSELDAITPSGGSAVARNAPAPEAGVVPAPGDAGEVLDAQARAEYRRRVVELREELEEAEARGDTSRVDAVRGELELLEDELRLAIGPGGRARRAPGDAERLRVAITHRIRAAIAQIARSHPALGTHLDASVSTGYRCVYEPAEPPALGEQSAHQRERKA